MSFACHSYAICMTVVCARMPSVRYLHLLVCRPFALVSTRMLSVCHSYVFVCHSYVTCMYSYITRMSLVCHSYVIRMSLVYTCMPFVCHSFVLVCHPYVTHMWIYYQPFTTVILEIVCICMKVCLLSFPMVLSKLCNFFCQNLKPLIIQCVSYYWKRKK